MCTNFAEMLMDLIWGEIPSKALTYSISSLQNDILVRKLGDVP